MKSENKNLTQLSKDLGITESEARARFFALYWGQKVLKIHDDEWSDSDKYFLTINEPWLNSRTLPNPDAYLELTHPSDISDELKVKASKMWGLSRGEVEFKKFFGIDKQPPLRVFDFFRCHGVALPWMNLSIEDLITLGWVRIRK